MPPAQKPLQLGRQDRPPNGGRAKRAKRNRWKLFLAQAPSRSNASRSPGKKIPRLLMARSARERSSKSLKMPRGRSAKASSAPRTRRPPSGPTIFPKSSGKSKSSSSRIAAFFGGNLQDRARLHVHRVGAQRLSKLLLFGSGRKHLPHGQEPPLPHPLARDLEARRRVDESPADCPGHAGLHLADPIRDQDISRAQAGAKPPGKSCRDQERGACRIDERRAPFPGILPANPGFGHDNAPPGNRGCPVTKRPAAYKLGLPEEGMNCPQLLSERRHDRQGWEWRAHIEGAETREYFQPAAPKSTPSYRPKPTASSQRAGVSCPFPAKKRSGRGPRGGPRWPGREPGALPS